MRNLEEIKKRFLKDNLAVRLGNIASDLARLKSFSQMNCNPQMIQGVIDEAKLFIEWTATQTSLDVQEELVNLQVQLALLNDSQGQKEITEFAKKWSQRVLELSGLLKDGKE